MPKVKRILVPVDFSEPSLAALRFAIHLARFLKARLEIVHVVEAITYAPMIGSAVDLEGFGSSKRAPPSTGSPGWPPISGGGGHAAGLCSGSEQLRARSSISPSEPPPT